VRFNRIALCSIAWFSPEEAPNRVEETGLKEILHHFTPLTAIL